MICRIYRWFIDCRVDEDQPLGPRLRRHVDNCNQCKSYYDGQVRIGRLLTETRSGCGDADRAVCQNIISILPAKISRPSRAFYSRWAIAAVMIFAVGIGALFVLPLSTPGPEQDLPRISMAELEDQLRRDGLSFQNNIDSYALETEMQRLSADTQAAADFLMYCAGVSP